MTRVRGLIVKPAHGPAHPFATMLVAEHMAQLLVERGRGPVEIVSAFTGDVLARYVGSEGNVTREEAPHE